MHNAFYIWLARVLKPFSGHSVIRMSLCRLTIYFSVLTLISSFLPSFLPSLILLPSHSFKSAYNVGSLSRWCWMLIKLLKKKLCTVYLFCRAKAGSAAGRYCQVVLLSKKNLPCSLCSRCQWKLYLTSEVPKKYLIKNTPVN